MPKKLWKGYTSSVNRLRQAWGFGVHSPFAFRLITKVIREKARYYAYDDIETIERSEVESVLSYRQKRLRKLLPVSRGRLIFRLTNFFQPAEVLEIGTAWGISSLYLRMASRSAHLTVVEPNAELLDFARQLFDRVGETARFVGEDCKEYIATYCRERKEGLFLFVNRLDEDDYQQVAQLLDSALDGESLLVIEGIRSNQAAKTWWAQLVADERVRVTIDLKHMGIVCCQAKLNKQNYHVTL